MRRCLTAAVCTLVGLAPLACGGEADEAAERGPAVEDPGPVHVHGLGVNPADGALFVATHTGLFRAGRGELQAERVADRYQDTMGFTVTGPNRFLGSGHPDGRENLPPFLGLIRSRDAGRTWEPVSLLGERDFHVLEAAGPRIYGYGSDFESGEAALLVSDDAGRSWREHSPPGPLIALAINPSDPDRLVVSGERGLHASTDGGARWEPLADEVGLLAWPSPRALFILRADGTVRRSDDDGRSWESTGRVPGRPAAFESAGDDLYVALHDGTIMRSPDAGRTWVLRSRP